jgi:hypothetical protein
VDEKGKGKKEQGTGRELEEVERGKVWTDRSGRNDKLTLKWKNECLERGRKRTKASVRKRHKDNAWDGKGKVQVEEKEDDRKSVEGMIRWRGRKYQSRRGERKMRRKGWPKKIKRKCKMKRRKEKKVPKIGDEESEHL